MGIRELRKDIGRKVDEAHYLKQAVIVTKSGTDWAFLGPVEWLHEREQMQATLAAYLEKYGPLEST